MVGLPPMNEHPSELERAKLLYNGHMADLGATPEELCQQTFEASKSIWNGWTGDVAGRDACLTRIAIARQQAAQAPTPPAPIATYTGPGSPGYRYPSTPAYTGPLSPGYRYPGTPAPAGNPVSDALDKIKSVFSGGPVQTKPQELVGPPAPGSAQYAELARYAAEKRVTNSTPAASIAQQIVDALNAGTSAAATTIPLFKKPGRTPAGNNAYQGKPETPWATYAILGGGALMIGLIAYSALKKK